jgi:hypothetical protein
MNRSARVFWLLVCVVACISLAGCGGSSAPSGPSVSVSISPKHAAVVVATQKQPFTATVTGTASDLGVIWSVDGIAGGSATVGTVDASGVYTSPSTAGSHTVTATAGGNSSASASATVAVSDLGGVFTYHNDLARDGANNQEYALTPSTVTSSTFGKLFSCAVDGAVYAQPLWVPSLSIGGGTHNVIFVSTEHDSVYAFDADSSPCVTYWQVNLLDTLHGGTSGEIPVLWNDVGYCLGDVYPEVGVTGTPVIDPTNDTIYLVAASEIPGALSQSCEWSQGTFYHRLHALDLVTGSEKFNAPTTIAASVPGTGDGSVAGMISFDSQHQHNRSALALSGSVVYVPFSAHEDATPYHGWLIGYNALNVSVQASVFNTTPNGVAGADGGIWASGGAPAVDSVGDIYISTGNGVYDASSVPPANDYGDSTLRLHPYPGVNTPNGVNLSVVGWFTPGDEQTLAQNDTDLGSGAPVLLPDQLNGSPHLLAHVGKEGVVYLIDRDDMGQFSATDSQIVQSFSGAGGLWGTPAFWQNGLYYAGFASPLTKFSFDTATGLFNPSPALQSSMTFDFPTATPSISSQGATDGVVWVIDESQYGYASANTIGNCYVNPPPAACTGPAVLHAYDAMNLQTEVWNSTQAVGNRDQAGAAVKFVPPTIANGKVYVGTRTEIDVYGLLPN